MSSLTRARTAFSVGSICLFLLLLLLPQMSPGPVNAAWDPDISDASLPKDPGTPFEEPEIYDPGVLGGTAPRGSEGGDLPSVTATKSATGAVVTVMREIVFPRLWLILWHLQ